MITIHISLHVIWITLGALGLIGVGVLIGLWIALRGVGDSIGRGLGW